MVNNGLNNESPQDKGQPLESMVDVQKEETFREDSGSQAAKQKLSDIS
jgi:hypothetical protein